MYTLVSYILGHCICWLQLELWILQMLKKNTFFISRSMSQMKPRSLGSFFICCSVQTGRHFPFGRMFAVCSLCGHKHTRAHKQCVGGCEDNKVMTKRDCWSVCSACEAQRFLWTPAFSLCICVSTVDPINWINRPVWLWCQRGFCLEQKAPHPSAWHCYAKDQKIQRMLMLTHLKLI